MSSAKIPPRFVPTLTDVVAGHSDAEVHATPEPEPGAEPSSLPAVGEEARQGVSSWAQEGMLSPRRGVVSLPTSLPPLPPDLAPQPSLVDELADWVQAPAVLAEPQDAMPGPHAAVAEAGPASRPPEATPGSFQPSVPIDALAADTVQASPPSGAEAMDGLWETHAQKITEEYLVHRLMQRVDLVLDQRLREAIATVVQEQTRSIVVRLREEVESVVRQAVYEAVADELAQQARTARGA